MSTPNLDSSENPYVSKLIPEGMPQNTVYLVPKLPDMFMLRCYRPDEDPDDAAVDGPYRAEDFVIEDGTNIMFSSANGGHPIFLRVTSQFGSRMECEDGAGMPLIYEWDEVPDNTLPVPENIPVQPTNPGGM